MENQFKTPKRTAGLTMWVKKPSNSTKTPTILKQYSSLQGKYGTPSALYPTETLQDQMQSIIPHSSAAGGDSQTSYARYLTAT